MTTTAPERAPEPYDPETAPKLDETALARIEKLALDPAQTSFTREQRAVLEALGWDLKSIRPVHAAHHIYFCAGHGVDPFMKEAMLFMTDEGPVNILMIAGFRKIANRTREYRGLSTFEFMDDDGGWHGEDDGWSPKWGRPVACRTYAHRAGWEKTQGMVYTEEVEVWEWVQRPGSRDKVHRRTQRWEQGHGLMAMLQKCAEAAALRRAFPSELDGFYEPAEMERVIKDRRSTRLAEEAARGTKARAERYPDPEQAPAREQRDEGVHEGVVVETGPEVTREQTMAAATRLRDAAHAGHPEPVVVEEEGSPIEEVPPPVEEVEVPVEPEVPALDEETRVDLLRAELDFQAEVFGVDKGTLTRRWADEYGVALEGWDSTMLLRVVAINRPDVAAEMSEDSDRWQQAVAYARVGVDEVGPLDQLLGLT
jgi:hypothetical protein